MVLLRRYLWNDLEPTGPKLMPVTVYTNMILALVGPPSPAPAALVFVRFRAPVRHAAVCCLTLALAVLLRHTAGARRSRAAAYP
jgi:hypothetical protein